MGYADMLGMFKGYGKGQGEGVEGDEAQGGVQGALRAGGGALQGVGAGMMSYSPRLSRALYAQDNAQQGAYHNMYMDQRQQDEDAQNTTLIRSIFGGNKAITGLLGSSNSATGMAQAPTPKY